MSKTAPSAADAPGQLAPQPASAATSQPSPAPPAPPATPTAAAAAAAATPTTEHICNICLLPVTNNLQCGNCTQLFCRGCLTKWFGATSQRTTSSGLSALPHQPPPQKSAPCPTCRHDGPISDFAHNSEIQLEVDALSTTCEYGCGAVFLWAARTEHLASACPQASVPCPYPSCPVTCPRPDLDAHVCICVHADGYSVDAVLYHASTPDRRGMQTSDALEDAASQFLAPPQDGDSSATLRHFVRPNDTLAGIAIQYGTTKQYIQHLNRLNGEAIFGHSVLLVPRPPNFEPRNAPKPSPEVIIALLKRRLVRRMMREAQLPSCEALAYLHLTDYDLDQAMDAFRADADWAAGAEQLEQQRPRTLAEFLASTAPPSPPPGPRCHGCTGELTAEHRHCASCGRFFCEPCQSNAGQCRQQVPKRMLGATNPHTAASPVPVCNDCYEMLAPGLALAPTSPAPTRSPTAIQTH